MKEKSLHILKILLEVFKIYFNLLYSIFDGFWMRDKNMWLQTGCISLVLRDRGREGTTHHLFLRTINDVPTHYYSFRLHLFSIQALIHCVQHYFITFNTIFSALGKFDFVSNAFCFKKIEFAGLTYFSSGPHTFMLFWSFKNQTFA